MGASEKSLPGFFSQQFNFEIVKAWVIVPEIEKNTVFCEGELELYKTIVILLLSFYC